MIERRCRAADWMPGLFHGEQTMRAVLATLPALSAQDIPRIVRFFENPASAWSLPGAISLLRHDCIHVLLGRGLTPEDEAFVLGFTMGQSDGKNNLMARLLRLIAWGVRWRRRPRDRVSLTRNLQIDLFRLAVRHFYPSGFRLTDSDLRAYDIGLGLGEVARVRNLETFVFEDNLDRRVGDLRDELGINLPQIEAVNRLEQLLVPGPIASRLDTDPGVDHAHLADQL